MLYDEILADVKAIENNEKLYDEKKFNARVQAIDDIEFHIIARIDAIIEDKFEHDTKRSLKQGAEKVKCNLENVNARMFLRLRTKISHAGCKGNILIELINEHLDYNAGNSPQQDAVEYDNLDVFINGLLTNRAMPAETKEMEAEMVHYQKTPARVILQLIKKAAFNPGDVFFDIGAGLGQAVILVNLLTSVQSKGIEFEPAFCSYANARTAELNINGIEFINADARYADYSSGTVFFMYTPFEGQMLQDVLQNLHVEAKKRTIKIFTYGPCTTKVAGQNWLATRHEVQNCLTELGEFYSVLVDFIKH